MGCSEALVWELPAKGLAGLGDVESPVFRLALTYEAAGWDGVLSLTDALAADALTVPLHSSCPGLICS